MTALTPTRSLLAATGLLLTMLAAPQVLAQSQSQPQSQSQSQPQPQSQASAPEPVRVPPEASQAASPAQRPLLPQQGLRYGAGYQARQAAITGAPDRGHQAIPHRRGRSGAPGP